MSFTSKVRFLIFLHGDDLYRFYHPQMPPEWMEHCTVLETMVDVLRLEVGKAALGQPRKSRYKFNVTSSAVQVVQVQFW